MKQQRSDPSMRAVESPHEWLKVIEPKERQIQKGLMNSSSQRVRVYIVHSFSKPFPLLHRKWLGKTETSGYTENFVLSHFSCVNLIFFLLCRHAWDVFTITCFLWHTAPAPRLLFLLNQILLCCPSLLWDKKHSFCCWKEDKAASKVSWPDIHGTFNVTKKRQQHVHLEKQTNLVKGFFLSYE